MIKLFSFWVIWYFILLLFGLYTTRMFLSILSNLWAFYTLMVYLEVICFHAFIHNWLFDFIFLLPKSLQVADYLLLFYIYVLIIILFYSKIKIDVHGALFFMGWNFRVQHAHFVKLFYVNVVSKRDYSHLLI